ncbi:DUF2029 domain-containing protein, partial [Candidatus Poribacteria bacterium]|nr:DUF2029 domain-containing protein [Candidatus Poribacteria bacterium]
PPARTPRGLLWLQIALVPAVVGLLAVGMLPIRRSALAMNYPYQLDREEGFLLEQAIQLVRGKTIYPPIQDYPYTVGNYPPVYPAMFAGLIGLIHHPSLPAGRVIVLLSTVMILVLLLNLVARETGIAVPGLLAAGLFLATWDVNQWIAFARVDLPAIAFGLAGMAALLSQRRRVGVAGAAALFLLAFFTKQTQVVAPAAALLGLIWTRDHRRAAVLSVTLVVFGGAGIALLSQMTHGEFLRHTVVYNENDFVRGQIAVWMRHLWVFGKFRLVALALLAAVIPAALWQQRWLDGIPREGETAPAERQLLPAMAAAYLVFSALSLISTGKAGAAANYLLEFHAAAALFTGVFLGKLIAAVGRHPKPHARLTFLTGLVICLLWLHTFSMARERQGLFEPGPGMERRTAVSAVELAAMETEGRILSEEPIFTILSDREVVFQPFIMSQLAREGKWNESDFVHDLLDQEFNLIITTQDLENEEQVFLGFTPAMRAAIRAAYQLDRWAGGYFLYVPRDKGERRDTTPWIASSNRRGARNLELDT